MALQQCIWIFANLLLLPLTTSMFYLVSDCGFSGTTEEVKERKEFCVVTGLFPALLTRSLTYLRTSVCLLYSTTCSCLVVAYLCCCDSGQAGQSCCFWYLPVMEFSWRLSLLSSTSCTTNCLASTASTAEAESVSILAIHPVPIHNLLNALFVARAISEKEWTVARPRTGKSTIQFNCSDTVTG